MSRDEMNKLAMECFEMWVQDLTDGELTGLLFEGATYPLILTRLAKICQEEQP